MAAIPDAVKNDLAVRWATNYPYVAVFTAASTTGNNEATGGGYARQLGFTSPTGSGGIVTGTEVTVPVAAGSYPEGGVFSAATAGTYGGSAAFAGGTVTVTGSGASIDVTPTTKMN